MKKVITMVALAMAAMAVSAENNINSTSTETAEINSVELTETTMEATSLEDVKPIEVYTISDEVTNEYGIHVTVSPALYFGANNALGTPENVDFKASNCHDIWLNNIIAINARPSGSKFSFSFGYGMKSDYYKMTNGYRFDLDQNYVVGLQGYNAIAKANRSSRIKTFSHTFALLASWDVAKKAVVRFGPVMSIATGKSILTQFEDSYGTIYSERSPEIKINRVTFDLMASATYYGAGLYVKYTPQSVFKKGYGPQFSTLTAGITVGF